VENFFDFHVKKADGTELSLQEFKGKVVLVVNVASKCGFTPQYEGLESLIRHTPRGVWKSSRFPAISLADKSREMRSRFKSSVDSITN